MMVRPFLLLSALALGLSAFSQATGIRFILPQYTHATKEQGLEKFLIGFGFDHDFNDRFSIGFDVALDPSSGDREQSSRDVLVPYQGMVAHYYQSGKLTELTYRTAFALSDNDEFHAYLGSFISYRHLEQRLVLNEVEDLPASTYYPGPFRGAVTAEKTMVPIGLRLGFQGSVEGGYADFYAEVGYCIGGGKSAFTQPYLNVDALVPPAVVLSLGFAFGIGWD